MYKTLSRMVSIVLAFALSFGLYSNAQATPAILNAEAQTSATPRVYAYYYLWWSTQHWKDRLGPNYPYNTSPLPLPATTDADGCNAVSRYNGNKLIDVPAALYSQDDPGNIENDIRTAKNAGISGFWLNWAGNGAANQTLTSVTYTRRLAEAFAASGRVGGFTNWVSYKAASMPGADAIINDLNFLYNQFRNEPAWERIDGKPVVTFTGSRKYSDADLIKVSNAVRDRMFLVGDESGSSLTDARLALFDALTYYWSSQNPYSNSSSFTTIKNMGDKVHAAGKRWYAPLSPGYNSILLGGSSCVPRRGGETLTRIWNGNAASKPDGWGLISWNEIAENSHVQPLQKWGMSGLNTLSGLINGAAPAPAPTATPTKALLPTLTATVQAPVPTSTNVPSATGATFDDKDPAFVYSSGWQTVTTSKAYKGSFKQTTQNGASVTFTFTGQSFSIVYKGGVTFSKFDVYVDGALVGTLDQKTSTTTHQQRWDYPGQLSPGTHTLKLVFKVTSSTVNKGSLDAVIVR